jgi:hypothetical protein
VLRGGHCNGAPIDIRKRVYRRRHRVHSDGRPRVSILRGTRAIEEARSGDGCSAPTGGVVMMRQRVAAPQ